MAAHRIRNESWKDDETLKQFLKDKVSLGYKRSEILLHVQRDFSQYAWGCVKTLGNRLKFFEITYTDHSVDLEDVCAAVEEEVCLYTFQ